MTGELVMWLFSTGNCIVWFCSSDDHGNKMSRCFLEASNTKGCTIVSVNNQADHQLAHYMCYGRLYVGQWTGHYGALVKCIPM